MKVVTFIFLLCFSLSTFGQTNIPGFTETEQQAVLRNFNTLLTKVINNDFKSIKSTVYTEGLTKNYEATLTIFNKEKYNSKSFIIERNGYNDFYKEMNNIDISTIIEVFKPIIIDNNMVEHNARGSDQDVLTRVFVAKNFTLFIESKIEEAGLNSTISLDRYTGYYGSMPVIDIVWPINNKGIGIGFNSNEKDSVWVESTFPNSPASKAGLLKNDLIEKINNNNVIGLKKEEILKLFRNSNDNITMLIKRKNTSKTVLIKKDFTYTYDKTCLSGNCVNGIGTALSNGLNGILYEGKFENGILVDGKWYANAKDLNNKGNLFRQGKIKYNRYFTGNSYDETKPDGGHWYQVQMFDVFSYPINEKTLNGFVKCYANNNINRYIWTGTFTNGVPDGKFEEFLYDKQLLWSYVKDGDKIRRGKLAKLDANGKVGEWLNTEEVFYDQSTKTWSSNWFYYNRQNYKFDKVSSYQDFESRVASANRNNSTSSTASSTTTGSSSKTANNTTQPKKNIQIFKETTSLVMQEKISEESNRLSKDLSQYNNRIKEQVYKCEEDMKMPRLLRPKKSPCSTIALICNNAISQIYTFINNYRQYLTPEAIKFYESQKSPYEANLYNIRNY